VVIIGVDMDRVRIEAQLDQCLLTDEEYRLYQARHAQAAATVVEEDNDAAAAEAEEMF